MNYLKTHRAVTSSEFDRVENSRQQVPGGQIPNSVLSDVMSGKKRATSEMMGHRENLAASVTAKMNRAFGMDFSGVKLYRSDVMNGTGVQGLAQGNRIVLSKSVNLNTLSGQAVLGHEFSHIHAQSQGIGLGHSGLYNNAALEQQADSEGLMAARGLNLNGTSLGMEVSPGMQGISAPSPLGSGMSAGAGAPMQAKDKKGKGGNPGSDAAWEQRAIKDDEESDDESSDFSEERQNGNSAANYIPVEDDEFLDSDEESQDIANAAPNPQLIKKPANPLPENLNSQNRAPKKASFKDKFFGGLLGGIGRVFQGLGAGLNLITGGHLVGSAYNQLSWDKGAGQAIGKGLLAIPSFLLNLPSTILGGLGSMAFKKGRQLWNKDWMKEPKEEDESKEEKLIYEEPDPDRVTYGRIGTLDMILAGGTNLSNRFINPGQDAGKSWVSEKIKRANARRAGVTKYSEDEATDIPADEDYDASESDKEDDDR